MSPDELRWRLGRANDHRLRGAGLGERPAPLLWQQAQRHLAVGAMLAILSAALTSTLRRQGTCR
jgi:hypothetical protein